MSIMLSKKGTTYTECSLISANLSAHVLQSKRYRSIHGIRLAAAFSVDLVSDDPSHEALSPTESLDTYSSRRPGICFPSCALGGCCVKFFAKLLSTEIGPSLVVFPILRVELLL